MRTSRKILIIPDSFKDSISAVEFCDIAKHTISNMNPNVTIHNIPMADGGEGSIDVFRHMDGYDYKSVSVRNPIGEEVVAEYCIQKKTKTAMIEMAKASGLQMIPQNQRNPMKTSSYGTGQLILDAINSHAKKIILFIGGSATNDIGVGMLEAIGFKYYNSKNECITGTVNNIEKIVKIEPPKILKKITNTIFIVACDVSNKLLGIEGATHSYGKQKGANSSQLNELERYLRRFSNIAKNYSPVDYTNSEGSGAAGGVGFSAMTFFGAEYQSGFKIINKLIDLEDIIENNNYDLIITGEGSIDMQTNKGKLLMHLGRIAKKQSIPVIAFGGTVQSSLKDLKLQGITTLKQISPKECSLGEAIKETPFNLEKAIRDEVQTYLN